MSSFPNVPTSNVFNTNDYKLLNEALTIEEANKLYLSLSGGTVGGNINTINLTASSSISSSIINSSQYLLNGSPVNFDAINGVTNGVAQANKALILNNFGNLQFDDGAGSGNNKNGTNALQWYGNTPNKEKILMYRPNDDSGLAIVSNPSTIQKCSPLLWLYSGFDTAGVIGTSSGEYKEVIRSEHKLIGFADNYRSGWFHAYNVATQAWGGATGTQFYTSTGVLNISANSSSTSSFASSNNLLLFGSGRMCFNTLTPFSDGTLGDAPITLNGGNIYIRSNNTLSDGSANYNTALLLDTTNANPVRFAFQLHTGSNATSTNPAFMGTVTNNDLAFMTNNSRKMTLTAAGRLGVGTSTPSCGLDIATGENSVTTTTNIAVNTLVYNVSNNTWSNLGGGPVTVNMCARFRGSAWIQDKIYATSDKRLKTDINPLDFSLEHYNQLNPVSYKWKNQDKITLGLIAQEVKNVCAESINLVENENMIKETDDDIEGLQYTLDYNCINIMNVVAIKKLIEQNKKLEIRLNKLEEFISTLNIANN